MKLSFFAALVLGCSSALNLAAHQTTESVPDGLEMFSQLSGQYDDLNLTEVAEDIEASSFVNSLAQTASTSTADASQDTANPQQRKDANQIQMTGLSTTFNKLLKEIQET